MMLKLRLSGLGLLLAVLFACPVKSAQGQDFLQRAKNFGRDIIQKRKSNRAEPVTGQDDAIERLAAEIDWLENFMDEYGSVSAKQPDIWGESRLTKYRHEVEKHLGDRIDSFALRDNASVVRADIAQLASVISIGSIADSSIADFKTEQTQFNQAQARSLELYASQLEVYQRSLEAYYAAERAAGRNPEPTAPNAPTIGAGPTAPSKPTFSLPDGVSLPPFPTLTPNSNTFGAGSNLEPVVELNQRKRYLDHLNQLRRVNEGDDTSDAPGYALNLVRIPVSILPGRATRRGYGAKVTVTAKPITSRTLLPSTFRNLAVNDLVDQLSLPVLRLAEEGQLELAMFFDKNLAVSDVFVKQINNMPSNWPSENGQTFREYLEQTIQLAAFADGYSGANKPTMLAITLEYLEGLKTALQETSKSESDEITKILALLKFEFEEQLQPKTLEVEYSRLTKLFIVSNSEEKLIKEMQQRKVELAKVVSQRKRKELSIQSTIDSFDLIDDEESAIVGVIADYQMQRASSSMSLEESKESVRSSDVIKKLASNPKFDTRLFDTLLSEAIQIQQSREKEEELANKVNKQVNAQSDALRAATRQLQESVELISTRVNTQVTAVSTSNRDGSSRFPISPAIFRETFGFDTLRLLANALKANYSGRHIVWNQADPYKGQIHLLDARKYLNACFDSAHKTISAPQFRELVLWAIENGDASQSLATLIETGCTWEISNRKQDFIYALVEQAKIDLLVANHCWCLVVEMAMLNKRLNEDVHQLAITKGDCDCKPGCYYRYYLPMPECSDSEIEAVDPEFCEAADAFCSYVQCRWPIHVFTIDPVHQEQNVSEASAVKRELSIAAALAFTSGNIDFNQLTRFQRQVQEDISTVGLNRTQTGFMHSNDTFGWQFSPRVQTRKPQGNLRAFGETLFGRGSDANWKEATLEPGMRECTAVVLMPSFVPYCDFDIRTNWFQINRPTHTDMSMEETMRLSRSVTRMRNGKQACQQCEHLYRPGEMNRLLNRVEQLERMLPLQSLRAQIPYENTLGGFDLFNNGLTDLGPRIEGWYGAPGIVIGFNKLADDDKKRMAIRPSSTSLFLVADNLSVNQTEIIAGGIRITDPTMISREVVEIKVPHSAQVVQVDGKPFVAVYVATPYGVTNHLHIPVVTSGLEGSSAKTLAELQKDLESKIKATPFNWDKKERVDYEVCFGLKNAICEHTKFELSNKDAKFKLEDNLKNLAKLTEADSREFAIVGAMTGPDKKPFGEAVLLIATQKFDDGSREWKASELFQGALLEEIGRKLEAKFFEKETKLALSLSTYILFKDSSAKQFDTPIKIGGNIEISVLLNQLCDSRVAINNNLSTPANMSNPVIIPPVPSLELDGNTSKQNFPSSLQHNANSSPTPRVSSRRFQPESSRVDRR